MGRALGLATLGIPLAFGGSSEFSPLSLSPVLWLKADAGTYQSSGGSAATADSDPVGEWQDQSGNGNHVTQGTGTAKPLLKLNVQNSLPGVLFDGSDDILAVATPVLTATASISIFAVVKLADTSEQGAIIHIGNGSNGYSFGVGNSTMDTSGTDVIGLFDGVRWIDADFNAGAGLGTGAHLIGMTLSSGGVPTCHANGATRGPFAGTAATTPTTRTQIGGSSGSATRDFTAYLLELVVVNAELSSTQRDDLLAYAQSKWGTP
jgi:hypothetical protein